MYDLNPNVAPTALISPVSTITLGQAAAFDGSGSADSDGTIASYTWDFGDGSTGEGATASHTYAAAGTYQATLTVTDDDGATGTAIIEVLVNTPPTAVIAPVSVTLLGGVTAFDGSASSDADGTIASYAWDFGDGLTGSGMMVNHTYAAAGTYQATLTVTDDRGATDTAEVSVRVNATPVAVIAPIQAVIVGEATQFDGSGSHDSDGTIASYQWSFGDGNIGSVATASHVYAVSGTYQVTLTVTDNDGATATANGSTIVQTPVQAINDLIALVQGMNLARGISNSLDTKLQNAASALSAENAGNRGDAVNKLEAFIAATQAQSGNQLTVAQANQLIAAAQRIIAAIE